MVADRVKLVQAFVKQALGLEAEPEETHGVVTVCQIVSHQVQIKCFSRTGYRGPEKTIEQEPFDFHCFRLQASTSGRRLICNA